MAEPAPEAARATFERVMREGRQIVANLDCTVHHVPPFLLATRCDGAPFDLAVRRVSAFAFVLSSIIVVIVATRAAPLPIIAVAIVWAGGGVGARLFARSRRRSLGEFLIDFERDSVTQWRPGSSGKIDLLIDGAARAVTSSAPHEEAPRWFSLVLGRSTVRIARCAERDVDALRRLFRSYKVKCIDE